MGMWGAAMHVENERQAKDTENEIAKDVGCVGWTLPQGLAPRPKSCWEVG
eukprot:m.22287 g.22287  ORF g.22287 m.22287 type:complete len:50 (+) comp3990_c1_seq1:90-239(+)